MVVPVNPSLEEYATKVCYSFFFFWLFSYFEPSLWRVAPICWFWISSFLTARYLISAGWDLLGERTVAWVTTEDFVPPQVCKQFTEAGFMADADLDSGCLLNKKIRNAQLAQYNFILGKKRSDSNIWCSIGRLTSLNCPGSLRRINGVEDGCCWMDRCFLVKCPLMKGEERNSSCRGGGAYFRAGRMLTQNLATTSLENPSIQYNSPSTHSLTISSPHVMCLTRAYTLWLWTSLRSVLRCC